MKAKLICMIIALLFIFGLVAGFTLQVEAKSKTIDITFSTYMPTSYEYLWLPMKHFAENVEKQTNGQVKFKLYHSGQLYKGKEEFAALERGDIDMTSPLDIYQEYRGLNEICSDEVYFLNNQQLEQQDQ